MATSGTARREPEAPPPPHPSRSSPPGAARSRRSSRALRWVAFAAGALGLLVLCACLGAWWLGSHLDHPWVKSRLVLLARDRFGLGIDYEGAELSLLRGVRVRSFRLLTPAPFAAEAPELARVERFELAAPLWTFALGRRSIDALRVGRIELALVTDASGSSSLSLLFPAEPEPSDDEPARISRALGDLPRLSIDSIEVAAIAGELIELQGDGSRRVSSASGLALHGAWHSDADGLAGTGLVVAGAPLALSTSSRAVQQQATVHTRLDLRAAEPRALSLQANASELDVRLGTPGAPASQHGVPSSVPSSVPSRAPSHLEWRGPLFALNATLRTDPEAGRASVAIEQASALGSRLTLDAQLDSFDASGLRWVTSGRARVDLPTLPFAVPGVSIDALQLELASQELAWDGARVTGTVDLTGRLRSALLEDTAASVNVADLTLAGQGSFQPESGGFRASLKAASLVARSLVSNAEARELALDLNGTTRGLAGAQQVEAHAALALTALRFAAPEGRGAELDGVKLATTLTGTLSELMAQAVPGLDARLDVGRLAVVLGLGPGSQRVSAQGLGAAVSARRVARNEQAAFGVSGDANVTLSMLAFVLAEGAGPGAARGGPVLSLSDLSAKADLPLSLERASGALAIATLTGSGGVGLAGLTLDLDAEAPLAWGAGGARAHAKGHLAKLDAGPHRSAQLGFDLRVTEPERERYRLELDAAAASGSLAGAKLAGPLTATLRADAAAAGELSLTSELRGRRGAAVNLALDARFDRQSEQLAYGARLSAEKLVAFAELVEKVAPAAGRADLARATLRASAKGDLSGVLRAGEGSLPSLAERPLASARGSQTAELALDGLDYRGDRGALRVPSLALTIESTHRAEAGGGASARLRLSELVFEGGGRSLRLAGVDQAIVASFDRAPDQGIVDVDTALEVGSLEQSWLPGFPVQGLRLSSNLQIDRLRSIFLRELALDNPPSGSALRAAGTLELLSEQNAGGSNTIVGREALSFEGRVIQRLEALEPLELASHARGSIELPFRLESGGLLGYRLVAAVEAKQVSFATADDSFAVEQLNGVVPVLEEFALLESGLVISAGPRTSPLSDTRFFDVHPFLSGNDYLTAQSIRFGGLAPLGPIAANVRIERSDFVIDQLQTGYQGGQIVGQVRAAWRDGDPIVRLRLNATGVRSGKSRDVFDANTALTFVPAALTLDGKMQIVRASREHVDDILDVLDPFHESANANRVRRALTLGYPKFVRFHLHDGAVDTEVELGGLAQLVRIDAIKAVPLGPILQKYVAPSLPALPRRGGPSAPPPASTDVPLASTPRRE